MDVLKRLNEIGREEGGLHFEGLERERAEMAARRDEEERRRAGAETEAYRGGSVSAPRRAMGAIAAYALGALGWVSSVGNSKGTHNLDDE